MNDIRLPGLYLLTKLRVQHGDMALEDLTIPGYNSGGLTFGVASCREVSNHRVSIHHPLLEEPKVPWTPWTLQPQQSRVNLHRRGSLLAECVQSLQATRILPAGNVAGVLPHHAANWQPPRNWLLACTARATDHDSCELQILLGMPLVATSSLTDGQVAMA